MFRMLKLRPPNGWQAVMWELAIVTLGVLIALGAQQWVEERTWQAKAGAAKTAIREELALHYAWSVEWRVVQPCISAQLERLHARVLESGERLDPAPLFSEGSYPRFVVRIPSKDYERSAWETLIGDGVSSHIDSGLRRELSAHYVQAQSLSALTKRNDRDYQQMLILSRPIQLDPMVRYSMLQTLEEFRARTEFMDVQSGQLIHHIRMVEMVPPSAETKREVERFGTYLFCKAQRLPMRSFSEAMKPVSS